MPGLVWDRRSSSRADKVLYLTFDDGPSILHTEWICRQLEVYQARGTFFCIGDNLLRYPELLARMRDSGHAVCNHTMQHNDGWKSDSATWIASVEACANLIQESRIIRPPYGHITLRNAIRLRRMGYEIIMWSFVAYDWLADLDTDTVFQLMKRRLRSGDIVVLHDSAKASAQMRKLLPQILEHYSHQGYTFKSL